MWARMQAISQNNNFRIIFSNDYQYQILDDDDYSGDANGNESIVTKDIQTSYYDVVFDPVPPRDPIFYPRGTLWPFGFTITLRNPSGTKKVIVSSAGRIRIE